jgi:hypothetical protein
MISAFANPGRDQCSDRVGISAQFKACQVNPVQNFCAGLNDSFTKNGVVSMWLPRKTTESCQMLKPKILRNTLTLQR